MAVAPEVSPVMKIVFGLARKLLFTSRVAFEAQSAVWDQKLKLKHSGDAMFTRNSLTVLRYREQL